MEPILLLANAAVILTVAWAAGACCFLFRLAFGIWGSHRLRQTSTRIDDVMLLELLRPMSQQLKLRCWPVIAYCERVPVVIGMFRPIVLLPTIVVTGLSSEQLVVVFGHELDHIRRNDLIVNLLQRIGESLLFFHPVVWFISRQMSDAQESCCDDLVVAAGCERMAYAGALLRMAELCCVKKAVMPTTVAASGQNPGQFERRIERMIDGHQSDQLRVTRAGFLTAIGFFLLTAGAGLLQGGGILITSQIPNRRLLTPNRRTLIYQ